MKPTSMGSDYVKLNNHNDLRHRSFSPFRLQLSSLLNETPFKSLSIVRKCYERGGHAARPGIASHFTLSLYFGNSHPRMDRDPEGRSPRWSRLPTHLLCCRA